ncbi:MAG: hypothetical protein O6916_06995 [bacterium]|nr:hypothetical protein [bacterium]
MTAYRTRTWFRGRQRIAARRAVSALWVIALLAGCGQEAPQSSYTILGIQDYSHGRVGRFSARVAVRPDMPRETVRLVIREVTAKVVEAHRADVCWVLVHTGEPATMDNLLASTQWVSPALPSKERPYIEVSDDEISYSGAIIYITWP